jgi:two-component system CheB/CheR fusion protein
VDHAPVIVGIGGSAGSLTPLRELFAALPAESGLAFVVVSHQAATGKSLLPEILAKTTAMPVREIRGETTVLPDHVYVAPRGHVVTVRDAALGIEPIGERSPVSLPIDSFFRSLARDRGHAAVGIVLSGSGSDGTLGLAAIRSASGLCLAQDPETAEFEGMPASAIAAQATDFVLSVGEMPDRLMAYARSVRMLAHGGETAGVSSGEMERILALIRVRGGHDFSAYKRETLLRRVERRMDLHRIERLADYARYLEENDEEIDSLWRDWLIGVSGFFRDPEAFQALAESGLPPLLAARAGNHPLRIWVPGCATGEEAYSIAIVVLETLEALGEQHLDVQVFATDLDPSAIQIASAGRYPKAIAGAVGARRLDRFFVEDDHGYRARKELRDRIVFAVQDVLHDPPFTRVDVVSCRNLLIYVVPSAQQGVLSIFHYSLNPGGLLLLGASEHVGSSTELFSTLDKRWKLYRRNDGAAARPPFRWTSRAVLARGADAAPAVSEELDLTETLRTCLAERFAPPAVVVDLRGRVRQTHGRVGPYLELPPGRANLNVLDLAREGLRAPLASALRAIAKADVTTVEKDVRVKTEAGWQSLRLTVGRIEGRRLPSALLLVSFEPARSAEGNGRTRTPPSKVRRPKRAQLEEELSHVRQDLQVSISDLQAANEELASANEEAESANEELQSSNEELQTSKEETQSLNEELQTVNAQLTEKLRGLEQANDDLLNLMSNLEIATIFLDERLRVKRFTPQARSVARLIDSDVGRPLADLATLLDYPDLLSDAGAVLQSLRPMEKQAPAHGGIWYTVRIRPYRTRRNAVEGLVVTFIDITETKRAERVQAARFLAESIVDAVHEPLLVLDPALRVVRANRSFYSAFRVEPAETEGQRVAELGNGQWQSPRLQGLLGTTLRDAAPFEDVEVVHEFPHIGRRRMVLSGRPVAIESDEGPALMVLGIQDAGPAPAPVRGEEA